ncbi:MAG: MMPL family transporter [Trueperaceae bacterium]|nr:MAG: MMPL family transporter [Trueperaceae bacterium]
MQWLANVTTDRPRLVIALFILLTALFGLGLSRLELDNSTSSGLPDTSPYEALDTEIKKTFGTGAEITYALVEGDIFTPEAFEHVRTLTTQLERLESVDSVTSLANAARMEEDDGFLVIDDLIPAGDLTKETVADIRSYLDSAYMYRDSGLFSKDGRYTALLIELSEVNTDDATLSDELHATFDEHWPGTYYLSGDTITGVEFERMIRRDFSLLTLVSALLILIFLFLNFRTIQGAVLPLITVLIGVLWSLGGLGLLGLKISNFAVIAPVAILAVGSSFSLHLLGRYYYELVRGVAKTEAIRLTVAETGLGVLISGLAISAAMCTFLFSDISAIRGLGLQTALGVISGLFASLMLLPALLKLLPSPKRLAKGGEHGPIDVLLRWLAKGVARHRIPILLASAMIAIIAVIGATRIVPNSNFIDFLPEGTTIRESALIIDEVFGGANQFQIRITGDLADPELLSDMIEFQERAKEIDGIGSSTSIASIVRNLHEVLALEAGMPTTREAVAQELLLYQMSASDVSDLTSLMTLDSTQGLLNVNAKFVSTNRTREMLAELEGLADDVFAGEAKLDFTGTALENLVGEDAIKRDFVVSLTLAILLVIAIDSMVRSVRAAIVTILALLITIALQYGILGFFGIDLDLATMVMGALAIGVGDYAIHLTVRYMEERRNGLEPEEAMSETLVSTGRAIFFTALTLGAGFAPLMLGSLLPIQALGRLMVITVVSVGVASLTLLPAACLTFLRNPRIRLDRTTQDVNREVTTNA